jgi:arabinofuranan 3-O-arabinosyltransferase
VLLVVAQSSVLVAFAFVQSPRWIAPDTKLDLHVNPAGFLERAMTLWDPTAAAGQLQNQAYGYLFPMGPFFALGHGLGLDAWVVQRLWWATLLVVAFHGMRLVLGRLGIGTSWSRVLAAFAYALAPRMLEGLGAISSEIWPMAVAPWVLVPLVAYRPGGERRAAAWSAVAVLAAGAVNAVATLAILVLPGWWLLTRRERRAWRLTGWWAAFVVLASAWWMGPLLLLGRYSPPFLDWIESSKVTTAGASLTEALRGTTQWIAALSGARGPQWPAGWEVLTSRPVIYLGLCLAVVGLAGLWRAEHPWRSFARGGLLIGLVLVTLGSVRSVSSPVAPTFATLLDGPLAPFRNTHKFEPTVRLVLCLGIAHVLPLLQDWLRRQGVRVPAIGTAVVVLAIVGQAAFPAVQGVSQRGQFLEVPGYWEQAADWVAKNGGGGRTLVLPGATNPASYWGDSRDEPLQPLADSPWMVRDAVPLGSAGATRLLNDVEARVASGYGGPELGRALRRLGVTTVLLRADLDYRVTGAPAPMVVRAALTTAGARPRASFGPEVGGSLNPAVALDGGIDQPTPALTAYTLDNGASIAPDRTVRTKDATSLAGGPEGTVLLRDPGQPALLTSDPQTAKVAEAGGFGVVLTDTLQRREANFAAVRDNYGPALRADQDYAAPRRGHDWLMPWLKEDEDLSRHQTVAELTGAAGVEASSSLAVPGIAQRRELTRVPESALDASGDTFWESAGYEPEGQWISVKYEDGVSLPASLVTTFDMKDGADVAAVRVTTDQGTVRTPISSPTLTGDAPDRYPVDVRVPPGVTRSFRLQVEEVRRGRPTVRIRDIGAGVTPRVESWLRLPDPGAQSVEAVHLQASPARASRCVPDGWDVVHCVPDRGRPAEGELDLRRIFTVPGHTELEALGSVYPRASAAAARLLQRPDGIRARSSTTWLRGPEVAPALVLDGDSKTYWASDPDTANPILTLSWPDRRSLRGLQFDTYPSVTGRRPTKVEVKVADRTLVRSLDEDGRIELPEVNVSRLSIRVLETTDLELLGNGRAKVSAPVVIGEVSLVGDGAWAFEGTGPQSRVSVPCGFGPRLQINGTEYPTQVSGTKGQLVRGQPLTLRACEPVSLSAGEQRLRLLASSEFVVRNLALRPDEREDVGGSTVEVKSWSATHRRVSLSTGGASELLTVVENANPGWEARLENADLPKVTVDGWAQGWVVPAGSQGTATLAFTPQRVFAATLGVGGLLALLVLAAAAMSPRGRGPARVPGERSWPPVVSLVAIAAAMFLLGGAMALLVTALVRVLTLLPWRWLVPVAGALAASAWLAWAVLRPWPAVEATNRDAASQVLALVVLAAAVTGVSLRQAGRRSLPHDEV